MEVRFVDAGLLIVAIVFFSSITIAPDVENYFIEYTSKFYIPRDVGFYKYMQFFKHLGLNFYEFKTIHLLICLEILLIAIKLITPSAGCVMVLYSMYPFFINVVQIRNFFIMSIVSLAIALLVRQKYKFLSFFSWVCLVLVAASFHIAALAFLPFIFLYDKDKVLYRMMLCLLVISVILVFFQDSFFSTFMQNAFALVDDSSRVDEVSERTAKYGSLYSIVKALMMIYVAEKGCIFFLIQKYYNCESKSQCGEIFLQYTKNLLMYSSLFWPLYVWGGSFIRLMQNEYIFLYVSVFFSYQSLLNISPYIRTRFKLNDVFLKMLIIFIFLLLLNVVPLFANVDYLLNPIFSNLILFYAFM